METVYSQLYNTLEGQITVLAPGLVLIKSAFDIESQIELCTYALSQETKFWLRMFDGKDVLNATPVRGRIYDAIEGFTQSNVINDICQYLVTLAMKYDNGMLSMNVTHLLLNYYDNEEGIDWHSDNDKNDGDNDHPIVSLSLGNACDFKYKLSGRAESTLRLESGDVLIWGGVNRMLPHAVSQIYLGTAPCELPTDKRLNFTFRDAPDVRGKERAFKYNIQIDLYPDVYRDDLLLVIENERKLI